MPHLIDSIKNLVLSKKFREQSRVNPTDFSRDRKLPLPTLIHFLLNLNNGSYQTELDLFFKTLNHLQVAERIVGKGSFSKARKKLKYQAFIELMDTITDGYYKHFDHRTWQGFNLLAIDGTTIRVPDEPEIIDHFGVWNVTKGKPCPKARGSQLFDVLNRITIDAAIGPKAVGEREMAASHMLKLTSTDLLLLDRGYPAFWLFKLVTSLDANFCARVSCTKWKVIRQFYHSNEKERIVKLSPPYSSVAQCAEMGLDKRPIKVRLVRVELENGETEILITSLLDRQRHPIEVFADLYFSRWPVEEDFKTIKCRLEVENFSGKSVLSVYQDFHAKLFSKNLTAVIASTIRTQIEEKSKRCHFDHKINFVQALAKMKNTIALLFTQPLLIVEHLVAKLKAIFVISTESIRPGRQYERNHKVKVKKYHVAYKPVC